MSDVLTIKVMDIISYKHDGELHRVWKNVYKLYEDDEIFVILNNKVFGKPQSKEEAFTMLKELSDKTHEVKTIYTVFSEKLHLSHTRVITSKVYFNKLSDELINKYIASGSPLDKAGAYGIQGRGSLFVKSIKGDYFNVVGLPVANLSRKLKTIL